MKRTSIIVVHQRLEQLTGSGCCGKLQGDLSAPGGPMDFPEARRELAALGHSVEEVRQALTDDRVEVTLVDARNYLYLWPRLIREAFRFRLPLLQALRTVFLIFPLPAVIVNGRVIFSREVPSPDQLLRQVEALA